LKTKTVLITGATSGLGESLARVYADENTRLLLSGRNIEKLQSLKAELAGQVLIYPADLSKSQEIERLIEEIKAENIELNVLINNAGIGFFKNFAENSQEEILNTMQVNTVSLMLLTRGLLAIMPENSHIVNIASIAGKIATPKSAVYAASKSAVIQFSTVLRMELFDRNIHVLCANFGPFRTPFHKKADQSGQYEKKMDKFMLDPDRLAQAIKQAQEKGKAELNKPYSLQMLSTFRTLFPRFFDALNRKLTKKLK